MPLGESIKDLAALKYEEPKVHHELGFPRIEMRLGKTNDLPPRSDSIDPGLNAGPYAGCLPVLVHEEAARDQMRVHTA